MIRRKTRFISIILSVVMLFGMMGYISIDNTYAASKKIHLKKTTVSLVAGKTYQQKLINKSGKTIKATNVKWKSAKTSVAKINKKGKVTAVKAGTAKMTAKYKGKTYKFTVKVSKPNLKAPQILDVYTGGDEFEVIVQFKKVKNAVSYELYCSKNGGDFKKYNYDTDYNGAFNIDGGFGTYVFKVRAVAGSYKGPFSEEKTFINAEQNTLVEVNPSSVELLVGGTRTISVITDSGCSLSYQRSNNNVNCSWCNALSGTNTSTTLKITGVKAGTTVIDVYDMKDPSVSASITVTIKPNNNTLIEVDPSSIELKVGEAKSVNVITDGGYAITARKSNSKVNCSWGNWIISESYTIPLTITGVDVGTTVIDVFDQKDNTVKNTITVTVKPEVDVETPALPASYNYYNYSGRLDSSCQINKIEFEYSGPYSGKYYVKAYFYGEKTYDQDPNTSAPCKVGYKLYDSEGYVVESGTFYSDSVTPGEKFKGYTYISTNLEPGDYKLVLLNVQ